MFKQVLISILGLILLSSCSKPGEKPPTTEVFLASLSGDGSTILTIDFGDATSGNALEKVVTLNNSTDEEYANLQIELTETQFQFKDGSYPGTGGTCGSTIPAKSSCTMVIVYTESTGGTGLLARFGLSTTDRVSIQIPLKINYLYQGTQRFNIVLLRVIGFNHKPRAIAQSIAVSEDTTRAILLQGIDRDRDELTYTIVTPPQHGTLSGFIPQLSYLPEDNYAGTDSFTFIVSDGKLESEPATVSVQVVAENDIPVANAQSVTTNEDTALPIVLSGSDVEGSPLTFIITSNPLHGTLSGSGATRTYTPAANYNGNDTIQFKVNDGVADSALKTISIVVTPVNDTPVAIPQSIAVVEDTAKAIVLSGTDIEGSTLTYSTTSNPSHGTLSGNGANRTYTPTADYNGTDSFKFKVNDGQLDSSESTITLVVGAQNDTPTSTGQNIVLDEDTPKSLVLGASDADADPLTYIILTPPSHGTLSGSGANWIYTPTLNFNGGDSFSFKVNDGKVDSNISWVYLTVTPVNDAPVANAMSVSTNEDTYKIFSLTGSDVENSPLTYTIVSPPSHGALTGTPPSLRYTPNLNYNGADSFTFKVRDENKDSTVKTVSITVAAVNDAPVANYQSLSVNEDTNLSIQLSGTDLDGDSISYIRLTDPLHGTIQGSGANLTYIPNKDYYGGDTFSFKVNDGKIDSASMPIDITVNSVPDAPTALSVTASTNEDVGKNISLQGQSVEFFKNFSYIIVTQPAHGTVSIGYQNEAYYLPAKDYNGTDSFTYKVKDSGTNLESNVATVTITINPINDPPKITTETFIVKMNTPTSIKLKATDVEGDSLSFTVDPSYGPSWGTLSGTPPNLTYTPNTNKIGLDSITYKVSDGSLETSGTAYVDVRGPASLDSTFGNNGVVFIERGPTVVAVRPAAQGKIILATQRDIRKFNSNGTVDTSFGVAGIVQASMDVPSPAQNPDNRIIAAKVDASGRILVLIYILNASSYDSYILRYLPNGPLDTSFGLNGKVKFSAQNGRMQRPVDMAPNSLGEVFIAGIDSDLNFGTDSDRSYSFLMHLNSSGVVDTNFQGGMDSGLFGELGKLVRKVLISGDGKILAYAETYWLMPGADGGHLARLNSNGSLDGTFGNNGIAVITGPAPSNNYLRSPYIHQDGKIYSFRQLQNTFGGTISRLSSNGIEEVASSSQTTTSTANDLAVDANGKILLVGKRGSGDSFNVERLMPDGTPDLTFGDNGNYRYWTESWYYGNTVSLLIQPTGRIVIAGSIWKSGAAYYDFNMIRLLGTDY